MHIYICLIEVFTQAYHLVSWPILAVVLKLKAKSKYVLKRNKQTNKIEWKRRTVNRIIQGKILDYFLTFVKIFFILYILIFLMELVGITNFWNFCKNTKQSTEECRILSISLWVEFSGACFIVLFWVTHSQWYRASVSFLIIIGARDQTGIKHVLFFSVLSFYPIR